MNSLMSSPHLISGLPANLFILILLSRPGCQSKIVLVNHAFGRFVILLAMRHVSLLSVSIRQGFSHFLHVIFCLFVLLLMYSTHSSFFSVVLISSFLSSWKDTSLSGSLFELCSAPSSVSLSVTHLLSSSSCSFVSSAAASGSSFFVLQCVSSFGLYDEAEHLSLRCLDHSFVFFVLTSTFRSHTSTLA